MTFRSFAVSLQRVGFKGIAYFDALVIDLEEDAVSSCDMTSLGK